MRPGKILSAFLLGMVSALLLLELALSVLGEFHRRPYVAAEGDQGQNPILCLGNSHTAGEGAPPGFSYCDALQRRIDTDPVLSRRNLRVVNLGVNNFNSTQVRLRLEESLGRYNPKLVLIMAGEPNHWNRWHAYSGTDAKSRLLDSLHDFLYRSRVFRLLTLLASEVGPKRSEERGSSLFPEVRAKEANELGYAWLGLLSFSVSPPPPDQAASATTEAFTALHALELATRGKNPVVPLILGKLSMFWAGNLLAAARWYRKSLDENPRHFDYDVFSDTKVFRKLGPEVTWKNESDELLAILRRNAPDEKTLRLAEQFYAQAKLAGTARGAGVWPADPEFNGMTTAEKVRFLDLLLPLRPGSTETLNQISRGYLELGEIRKAIQAFEPIAAWNPNSTRNRLELLVEAKTKATDSGLLAEAERLIARFAAFGIRLEPSLSATDDGSEARWIARDLTGMAEELKSRGIPFLLMTYPPLRASDGLRTADEVARTVARERGLPLFDTHAELRRWFLLNGDKDRYYSGSTNGTDNHLNAEGYKVLGDLLFADIKRRQILR